MRFGLTCRILVVMFILLRRTHCPRFVFVYVPYVPYKLGHDVHFKPLKNNLAPCWFEPDRAGAAFKYCRFFETQQLSL